MENKKCKNILVVSGIQRGHFTGSVEIVRELSSLGHNVTCYVLDEYEERMKNVGAKVVAYKVDRDEIKKKNQKKHRLFLKMYFYLENHLKLLYLYYLKMKLNMTIMFSILFLM